MRRSSSLARRHRGFTLVELLAALALSAALMTVGFRVLRSVGRPLTSSTTPDWLAPLARQIRWDSLHAVAWRPTADDVTLAGHLATDPATLDPLHRPAIVTLRVERIGGVDWLVRDEVALGLRSGQSTVSQLLCAGVRTIHLTDLDPPSRPAARGSAVDVASPLLARDASVPPVFRDLPGLARMPDRFRVVVDFDDAKRMPLTIDGSAP